MPVGVLTEEATFAVNATAFCSTDVVAVAESVITGIVCVTLSVTDELTEA